MLLATADAEEMMIQTTTDQQIINTQQLSPEQCAVVEFTQKELEEETREAIVTNEDVGRYVGYGRKDIKRKGGMNL